MAQTTSSGNSQEQMQLRAAVDFVCLDDDCDSIIKFNVMDLEGSKGRITCPECRREYHFSRAFLDKLQRLRTLIMAVRGAEDMLGDINVAVTTPMGEVKVPYRLLLTRLNTIISLDVDGRRIDFNFRIEPLNEQSIR
jgi:hypothetical protein